MIQTFCGIIIALLIFGFIVLIHEFGHFFVAKKFGVKIQEFSIGMGPRMFSKVSKEGIRYSIKLFPIGGSCSMMGEDEDNKKEGSFNSIAMWKRMVIVFAGPLANILLAFVLSIIIIGTKGIDLPYVTELKNSTNAYKAGLRIGDRIVDYRNAKIYVGRDLYFEEYIGLNADDKIYLTFVRNQKKYNIQFSPNKVVQYKLGIIYNNSGKATVTKVEKGSVAEKQGLKKNDVICRVDNAQISSGEELAEYFQKHTILDERVKVIIQRGDKIKTIYLLPQKITSYANGFEYNTVREKSSPNSLVKYAFMETRYAISYVVKSLKLIVRGRASLDDISGPVGIIDTIGTTYKSSKSSGINSMFISFLQISILLTANLGIINLLPIPALDGGRIFIYIIQLITRREINKDKEGIVHFVGFVLLMCLMILLVFNDIRKLV